MLTDQTSAHDPLVGYIPEGYSVEQAAVFRKENEKAYLEKAYDSMAKHVRGMLEMKRLCHSSITCLILGLAASAMGGPLSVTVSPASTS